MICWEQMRQGELDGHESFFFLDVLMIDVFNR